MLGKSEIRSELGICNRDTLLPYPRKLFRQSVLMKPQLSIISSQNQQTGIYKCFSHFILTNLWSYLIINIYIYLKKLVLKISNDASNSNTSKTSLSKLGISHFTDATIVDNSSALVLFFSNSL